LRPMTRTTKWPSWGRARSPPGRAALRGLRQGQEERREGAGEPRSLWQRRHQCGCSGGRLDPPPSGFVARRLGRGQGAGRGGAVQPRSR
jgi:hypothetical protein